MFLKIMLKHVKKNKTFKRVETRVKLTLTFWDNESIYSLNFWVIVRNLVDFWILKFSIKKREIHLKWFKLKIYTWNNSIVKNKHRKVFI